MNKEYIITNEKKPCCICQKLTNRLNYLYESYFCSQECEDVMNTKYEEQLKKEKGHEKSN